MKRCFGLLLTLLLLFSLAPARAEGAAVSAALPAEIASFFADARFSGSVISAGAYVQLENTPGGSFAFAVVTGEDANTLYGFRMDEGKWTYYLKSASALPQQKGVFYLSNVKGARYTDDRVIASDALEIGFQEAGNEEYWAFFSTYRVTSGGQWELRYLHSGLDTSLFATVGQDHISYCDDCFQPLQTVNGVVETNLRYFDWSAFPRTPEQAREKLSFPPALPASSQLTALSVALTGGQHFAVYSGPGEWYQRGANGKAAVSTNDWVQVFGAENGYLLIQYAVSSSQMRFGYIPQSAAPALTAALHFSYDPAVVTGTASLTDDPLVSQQSLCTLWAGEQVKWLATLGDWVYVEYESGSQAVRGFLPAASVQRMLGASRSASGQFSDYTVSCQFTDLDGGAFKAVLDVQFNGAIASSRRVDGYAVYANQMPVDAESTGNILEQTESSTHSQFTITGTLPSGTFIIGFCPVRNGTPSVQEMLTISLQD